MPIRRIQQVHRKQAQGKHKIIAIVGPTASGKSTLAVYLAQKLNGEIISADSRQVYKGLDIGTGKVTKREMGGIPHHLLNVVSPKKQFSVDDFVQKGTEVISGLIYQATPKLPIVVGGTGLYVDALLGRITFPNVPPNPKLRDRLEKKSVEQLFAMLQKQDQQRAKTIEPKHKRRLIRALEIAAALRRRCVSRSECKTWPSGPERTSGRNTAEPYEILWLGLKPSEQKLKKNIRTRLFERIRVGMIAEAKKLHTQGLSYKRMHELGLEYRYLAKFLQGNINRLALETELERDINKYAKRQMRWFKRNKDIVWVKNKSDALQLSKKFLQPSRQKRG
ncbi:MAG: tRNA (adenosine(37)-N6)-dimethylallyltransferase MiaA [bacterium]|nr:tRNA (adenosine(37)-N6)-dimethylallyltransferase MiaA [bacterium]